METGSYYKSGLLFFPGELVITTAWRLLVLISTNSLTVWPVNSLLFRSLLRFHSREGKHLKQLKFYTVTYPIFSNSFLLIKDKFIKPKLK